MKTIYSYGIEQETYSEKIYKSCIYIVMRSSNFSRRNIRKKTVIGDKFYINKAEKSVEALFDTDITENTKIKVWSKKKPTWKCISFKKIDYYGIMEKYPKDYEYFDKLSDHFKQYLETVEFEINYEQYENLNKFIIIDTSEVDLCLHNSIHLLNNWTINEVLEYIIKYKDQNKEEKMKDFISIYIY